jgi:hypothetical protein
MAGWRHINVVVHRDLGFLVAALTVVYAVSGIAVNHTHQWNPSYRLAREARTFAPIAVAEREVMVAELVKKLELGELPKDSFRSRPDSLELFYEGWSVKADATAGTAVIERPGERPGLFQANFLHLNRGKGWWTWVADAFAVALIVLAVGGALIPRGKKGLSGHGKYWVLLGVAVPLGFLLALSSAGG